MFTTVSVRLGSLAFGSAEDLNRFSNAGGFCKSLICGIDRNNIAQGADAVHSLNKTRHVVSAITDSVFPVSPDSIKDKFTILSSNSYDLYITQTALASSALENEFIEMQVSITNPSIATQHHLDLALAHLNAGPGDYGLTLWHGERKADWFLADKIAKELARLGELEKAVVRRAEPIGDWQRAFYCLDMFKGQDPNIHIVLVEPWFLTNKKHQSLAGGDGPIRVGTAIAHGIMNAMKGIPL